MTATAVLRTPSAALPPVPAPAGTGSTRAASYQRVLHQLVRRELRLLGELATWAPADDRVRAADLTRHAALVGRVLLQHHAVERDRLWPALQQALPQERADQLRPMLAAWTARCAAIDLALRDLGTAARQWSVAPASTARDAFAMACLDVSAAVAAQTEEEERELLPLLGELDPAAWAAIRRSVRSGLSPREQRLVLGLALEDACATDRARLLSGLPAGRRLAWRLAGRSRYRAAVVRLRGAPPAV